MLEAQIDTKLCKNPNRAATKTKEQSQILRIRNELKFLQIEWDLILTNFIEWDDGRA